MSYCVEVSGYDPLSSLDAEADVELHIRGVPPARAGAKWYEDQARLIVGLLCRSLPQATLNRVLIKLMEHHVGVFRGRDASVFRATRKGGES